MQLRRALLITFSASLLFSCIAYFICIQFFSVSPHLDKIRLLLVSSYMWIPGICALICGKQEGINLKIFKKPSIYSLHALLIPLVIVTLGVLLSIPFHAFSTEHVLKAADKFHLTFSSPLLNISIVVVGLYVLGVFASLTSNFLFALGEELFWRGYVWEKLKGLGFWRASLFIGALWGIWHAPIVLLFGHNYPEHPILGIILMVVLCILMTPVFLYLRIKDESLMAPTIFHGMFNAFCPICVVFFPGARELLVAPLGLGGMLALFIMNGYFFRPKVRALLA